MLLEWEDGYRLRIAPLTLLCGIMRKGKRPIKLIYYETELDAKHEIEKQKIKEWFHGQLYHCLDPIKREIIKLPAR